MSSYRHQLICTDPAYIGWGKFIAPERLARLLPSAVKLAIFGSFYRGLAVTQALADLHQDTSAKVQIVGLATDAIADPKAKISAHKRVWQFVDNARRESIEKQIIDTAITYGIPVYSGQIKCDYFKEKILSVWNPDLILMCTFGQLVDQHIFQYPKFGMYNLHPSHLAKGKYPGANPFTEMLNSGESTTRMTLHEVDEDFDTGRVLGYSPPINICPKAEVILERREHIIALHQKTAGAAAIIARALVRQITMSRSRIEKIDCEKLFTKTQKEWLMKPISEN